ncbi:zinc ribbon domain-containing protein [Paenibacillus chibensis]|uniref:Zinc ribbon domain-containing protein n=1 Tax=Paenibacillus chibensis TaxID=59846 RepID=A0ABU6PNM1_9BACL|nr:zinc ribbon domain-containing protein [Paenibacillus chibensis]
MPVKICPECGVSNSEHAEACSVCGASLHQVKKVRSLNSGLHAAPEGEKERTDGYRPVVHRSSGKTPDSSASGWLSLLLVIATVIYPFVGMIVGGVIAFSEDKPKRARGEFLLIVSLIIWGIRLIIVPLFSK